MGELDLDAMGRMGVPMPSAKEGVLNSLADIVRLRSAGWGWKAVSAWLYGNRSVFVLDAAGGLSARPVGQTTVRDYVLTALPADSDEGRAVRGRFKGATPAVSTPAAKHAVREARETPVAAPRPQAKPATASLPERKVPAAKGMLSASDLAPKGPSEGDLILKELGISDEIKVEDVVKSAGLYGLPGVEDPAPETGETDVDEQDVEIRGPSDGFCDMPEGIEFDDGDVPPPPSDDDAADALAGLLE